jgi:tetratricopeptide (TPR) repeat protein
MREDALNDLRQALKLSPEAAPTLNFVAYVFQEMGHLEEALELYNRLVLREPANLEYRARRAKIFRLLHRYEEALDDNTTLIHDDTLAKQHAYVDRAVVYIDLLRYKDAVDDCSKLLQLQPRDARLCRPRSGKLQAEPASGCGERLGHGTAY